jgi:hypothetical protein
MIWFQALLGWSRSVDPVAGVELRPQSVVSNPPGLESGGLHHLRLEDLLQVQTLLGYSRSIHCQSYSVFAGSVPLFQALEGWSQSLYRRCLAPTALAFQTLLGSSRSVIRSASWVASVVFQTLLGWSRSHEGWWQKEGFNWFQTLLGSSRSGVTIDIRCDNSKFQTLPGSSRSVQSQVIVIFPPLFQTLLGPSQSYLTTWLTLALQENGGFKPYWVRVELDRQIRHD